MLQLIANDNVIEVLGEGRTQKTLRFQAHSGDRIIIQDAQEKHTQIKIKTKKVDDDLYVFEDGVNIPSVIIKDYFAIDEIGIYAYNENGVLVRCEYAQINNVDGLLNLSIPEKMEFGIGQLALGGLAIGVVGAMGGGGGGSNADTTAPNAPTVSLSDDDNNGKPTASGLAEANSTVTIIWADGSKSITKADSNGKYSIEASTVQLNGDVTAVATDASGNTSSLSTATYNDKQAPQAPTLLVEDTDGDGKPTASGTAEPKSTVIITWPNGTTSTTKADDDGNYSIESPNTQPSGNVSVMGTDINFNDVTGSIGVIYSDNIAPTAVDDSSIMTEDDTSVDGNVSFNDTDKDGSEKYSISAGTTGTYGSIVLNDDGTYTYTRNTTDLNSITTTVSDVFTYKITDSTGNATEGEITIDITPQNDVPDITGDINGKGNEDNTITGVLSVTDVDGMNDGSYFTVTNDGTNGKAIIDAKTGAWGYEPNDNYNGSDSFVVTITDDQGHTTKQEITLAINQISDTFSWVVADMTTTTLDNFDIEGTVDVLNVDELLIDESGDATDIGTLLDYIHIEAGTDSTIHISSSGGFTSGIYDSSAEDKTIILNNVNLSSFGADDEAIIKSMISGGILVA